MGRLLCARSPGWRPKKERSPRGAAKGEAWGQLRVPCGRCGGAGTSGQGRAAAPRRRRAGSWSLAAPGMSRLCPEERESVPRQGRETTLFPGEDDSALPEALFYFMPGIYRSSAIRFALSALTPQTSRGASALPALPAPLRTRPCPCRRWLPGRQRRSAIPTQGAERTSPPLLTDGNF